MNRELITSAFEKLGPKKVARGLRALATAGSFYDCFVALAYGPAGALQNSNCDSYAEAFPGMSEIELDALWEAWDDDGRAFRKLAREWLEQHPPRLLRSGVRTEGLLSPETVSR